MTGLAAASHPQILGYVRRRAPERRDRGERQVGAHAAPVLGERDVLFWLTALLLGAALLFGGASRENGLQLLGLELLSLPVIPLALWRLHASGRLGAMKLPLALLAAMIALPLLQLAPIPFDVWAALPGRGQLADGLRLAGVAPASLPFSLTPGDTRDSALALLVPAAVFLGAAACAHSQRKLLAWLVVLAAGVSLVLGLLQVAGGPESPLRFYSTTNLDSAVGLFANRNHLAITLLITLPLGALWIQGALRTPGRSAIRVALLVALFGLVVVGVATTLSRAGLILLLPAVAATLLTMWRGGGARSYRVVAVSGLMAVLATILAFSAIQATLARFPSFYSEEIRLLIWPNVTQSIGDFMPLGSGIGSFQQVYRIHEPIEMVGPVFVNAAHNDYLQLALEGGLPALALVLAFGVWLVWRSVAAWRRSSSDQARLARVASVQVALLALHSVVDYPLRTLALACVLALACAILVRPAAPPSR